VHYTIKANQKSKTKTPTKMLKILYYTK